MEPFRHGIVVLLPRRWRRQDMASWVESLGATKKASAIDQSGGGASAGAVYHMTVGIILEPCTCLPSYGELFPSGHQGSETVSCPRQLDTSTTRVDPGTVRPPTDGRTHIFDMGVLPMRADGDGRRHRSRDVWVLGRLDGIGAKNDPESPGRPRGCSIGELGKRCRRHRKESSGMVCRDFSVPSPRRSV